MSAPLIDQIRAVLTKHQEHSIRGAALARQLGVEHEAVLDCLHELSDRHEAVLCRVVAGGIEDVDAREGVAAGSTAQHSRFTPKAESLRSWRDAHDVAPAPAPQPAKKVAPPKAPPKAPVVEFAPTKAPIPSPTPARPAAQPQEAPSMTHTEKFKAALEKAGRPLSRDELAAAAGLEGSKLSSAIFAAKQSGDIVKDGSTFILPTAKKKRANGTDKPARGARKAFGGRGKGKAAKTPSAPRKRALGQLVPVEKLSPPMPATIFPAGARAIRTMDGGAIVLDGNFAAAYLTPAQFDAVANLTRS